MALGVGGGISGEYIFSDHRYSVEQEYALMSLCVGEQGKKSRKDYCINELKQCHKKGLDVNDCKNYFKKYVIY